MEGSACKRTSKTDVRQPSIDSALEQGRVTDLGSGGWQRCELEWAHDRTKTGRGRSIRQTVKKARAETVIVD